MSQSTTAVIFDIGNVICRWDPKAILSALFSDPEKRREAAEKIIRHPDWAALDRGTMTLQTAVQNACTRTSFSQPDVEALFRQVSISLTPNPPVVETLYKLRELNYPLYVLSNMPQHVWEPIHARDEFWAVFDGIVVSFEEHLVKPEAAIFARITQRFDLDPAATLFLDDMQENVAAARQFGLQAIHVRNPAQGMKDLYRHLGIGDGSD